ncbi:MULTISPECIES: hypothetical protein [unclassified Streptomyces]|uniref:hypothetical protein n=1 Tax=Streptomyces sp. NBRC 14336 TaxID=3030992 RepID=UPI0025577CA7|nr:hypothetical protein [Streptomyces sp. NBRC 14336]WBO80920.1 hypothetical protein SBE_004733 [Streptomyces sp. SBE_14.2]
MNATSAATAPHGHARPPAAPSTTRAPGRAAVRVLTHRLSTLPEVTATETTVTLRRLKSETRPRI